MKQRYVRSRLLAFPSLTFVFGAENRTSGADNPCAPIVNDVNVNQLSLRRRAQDLPGPAAVARHRQNTVRNHIVAAHGTDDPPALPAVKSQTVELRHSAVEFTGQKLARLNPGVTAIGRLKDAAARQRKAMVLIRKIDIVNRPVGPQPPLNPGRAAVIRVSEVTSVSAHPAAFRIN